MDPSTSTKTATRWHSTRRVVVAGVIGIALGLAGAVLLIPTPVVGPVAASGASPDASAWTAPVGESDEQQVGSATAGADLNRDSDGVAGTGPVDQAAAERAALAYVGAGRVTWVTREDDGGAAWEIEVTLPNGREVDVYVDVNGQVVDTRQGLARLLP